MAEILIKGMKMPKSCNECPMKSGYWCYIDRCVADAMRGNRRRKDCPLAEISLERDTPKAPVLKDGESLVHLSKADGTGEFRSSKWLHWTCPVCGAFVGELYVYEGVRHIQRNTPYCAQCGQKIDWDTPRNEIRLQEEN